MKHTIRIMTLMAALLFSMATESWALSGTDIKFATIQPVPEAGTVKVKEEGGVVGRKVTIVATPATNYYIEKSGIVVQKLVSPSRMAPRRRAPQLTDTLGVSGPAESGVAAEYTFVIPEDYDGALVTVTFTGKEPATADIKLPTLYYNTEAQELIQSAAVTGGTIKYTLTENAANDQYSETIPTGTNAQEYTVYYKVFPDDEHSATLGHVKVKILPAPLTQATWQQSAQNHTGSELTFSLKEVKAGELTVPATTGYTLSGNSATDIGSYTATVTGTGNFAGELKMTYRVVGSSTSVVVIDESTTAASISALENKLSATYILASDIDASVLAGLQSGTFTGELDGDMHKISNVSHALFTTLTGTAKNVMLEKVKIESGTNVGAIANEASGSARIYNCGVLDGSVSGSGYVGGLVGKLDGEARVINCFSYANIAGGSDKGGIVGYNNKTSSQASLTTMVMNCMFYGDIAEGNNISPIYGGTEINNVEGGMNNYNYYRYRSSYSVNKKINKYNRALAMEEKFINRFERYRLLLNSNKKLAAIYATGSAANADQMAKWVLETADRTTATPKPYPILKRQDKYPSVINYDATNAPDSALVGRLMGGRLGRTLAVTIRTKSQKTNGGQTWPTASGSDVNTKSLTLIRTDKDTVRNNFNYDKVQLPYYNDVGTGNYTERRVVTGWKITDITGGTAGAFSDADEWGGYNFADRNCTNKDKYSESGRVFSQGAYWDVPNGVTAITIEPYWAIANYVSDDTYDVVYDKDYNKKTFTTSAPFGKQYTNNTDIDIYGDGNKQKVYTSISAALSGFNTTDKTVYDQAVVLVGNVHQYANPTNGDAPYTLMSIDMDHDNEPDYSFIFSHNNRQPISPIRYDFLNIMGMAETQIPKDATLLRNVSIFNLKGWFEITNTCLVNFSQFEYDNNKDSNGGVVKSSAPLILLGGTFEQFVSTQKSSCESGTKYIHIGSNAWFAKFGIGTHSDGNKFTAHVPVSVTGGDYDEFYLSGTYQPNISNMQEDNAECYVSGGRFGEMAGASLEPIWGDVRWDINWADITNFYGGGVNAVSPITGDIKVDMMNSHVSTYCGGPKFGDMSEGKKVTTTATDCVFGTYFGAGYGGNAYNRVKYKDEQNKEPASQQSEYASERGKYYDGTSSSSSYGKKGKGVATDFDYEFFVWSTGGTGSRFYVKFITFSLATTRDVTSNLTKCKVTGNVYGGGSLGKVDGDVSTTLNSCEVSGNVFGAGYSATLPKVEVRNTPAFIAGKEPKKNMNIGMFEPGEINTTEEYEWKQVASANLQNGKPGMVTDGGNYVYTDEDLSALGTVTGKVTLNITGSTTVTGDVFGGGESSDADGDVVVNIKGGSMTNVYGGGSMANVGGDTEVNLTGGTIANDVYGGGKGDADHAASVGSTLVKLNGTVEVVDNVNTYPDKCVVNGRIFGCNNLNGSPTGTATVHIYKTWGSARTEKDHLHDISDSNHKYHLRAVYGGGNLAPYTAQNGATHVIIDGCDMTSIRTVYGGGNAASTPATLVDVNGSYEIEEVFGGGNGKDSITVNNVKQANPGANVGYYAYPDDTDYETRNAAPWTYGTGEAHVNIYGGLIHRVFGGSNTKGNVRQIAVTLLDGEVEGCDFSIDEAYGGGKSAPMDGASKLEMACIPGLKVAYGGAEEANINNDVTLNITNGTFDRVFGGNNVKGTISGKITVNIEETGCRPIIIGQLYGGGNQAPYTAKNVEDGPTLNIRSFTSIGDVFGGGYGKTAVVTGDTHVNINVCKGRYADYETDPSLTGNHPLSFTQYQRTTEVTADNPDGFVFDADKNRMTENITIPDLYLPPHASGKIGGINRVYGGGNQAEVIGDTHVYIGTTSQEIFATPASALEADRTHKVDGVNILGNVYGGGNQANVTGRTNVVIGKQIVAPTSQGSDDQGEGNQDGN